VLKPGGRLAISDILATAPLPEEIKKNLALLSACVGGAETFAGTEAMLREAGFEGIAITPNDNRQGTSPGVEAGNQQKRRGLRGFRDH
jgi:arsenite methyltransferase